MRRVGQAIHHAGFPEQVAQHQHADERRRIRNQQDYHHRHHNGKQNFLRFRHLAQLLHLDRAFLLGGHRPHNGRLDQRDKRHIGVGRDGNGRQIGDGQPRGTEDCGGAVCPADDRDSRRHRRFEAQGKRQQKGCKNPQLRARPHQHGRGAGNQGAEVGHGPNAQKNNGWVNGLFHALIEKPEQAGVLG
ncbi:hypothetical protein SDC9_142305 [bioreactor metagenome]|uniref:Uncharacterized protein n=1 Tax=bioreactor metagenome TaxID=1076179 RepID=A0A645E041_9ZZZZ